MALERIIPEPTNYKEKRVLEYPSLGDVIDALVKKKVVTLQNGMLL